MGVVIYLLLFMCSLLRRLGSQHYYLSLLFTIVIPNQEFQHNGSIQHTSSILHITSILNGGILERYNSCNASYNRTD